MIPDKAIKVQSNINQTTCRSTKYTAKNTTPGTNNPILKLKKFFIQVLFLKVLTYTQCAISQIYFVFFSLTL